MPSGWGLGILGFRICFLAYIYISDSRFRLAVGVCPSGWV